jgi:catechol 2,3-dioxygenase-like lactoylglutathione lyase family enzyme
MGQLLGFKNVVFPARNLAMSVDAWTAVLGQEPAYVGDDFAVFTGAGAEVGLSSAPWVDHPLVFWEVEEIEEAHRALVAAGAVPLGEIADGSLAEIGTADVTNGDATSRRTDTSSSKRTVHWSRSARGCVTTRTCNTPSTNSTRTSTLTP